MQLEATRQQKESAKKEKKDNQKNTMKYLDKLMEEEEKDGEEFRRHGEVLRRHGEALSRRSERRDTITGLIKQMHHDTDDEANKKVVEAEAKESKILLTISESQRKPKKSRPTPLSQKKKKAAKSPKSSPNSTGGEASPKSIDEDHLSPRNVFASETEDVAYDRAQALDHLLDAFDDVDIGKDVWIELATVRNFFKGASNPKHVDKEIRRLQETFTVSFIEEMSTQVDAKYAVTALMRLENLPSKQKQLFGKAGILSKDQHKAFLQKLGKNPKGSKQAMMGSLLDAIGLIVDWMQGEGDYTLGITIKIR